MATINKKNNYTSQTLNGVTYSLRTPPPLTYLTAAGMTFGTFAMVPFLVMNGLVQVVIPSYTSTCHAFLVSSCMGGVEKEFGEERATLLRDVSGVVLDLGSGAGPYLKHCLNAKEVIAVEPLLQLHKSIQQNGTKLNKLSIFTSLNDVPKEIKFDWVILGNVMCEVKHPEETLKDIDDRLQPGGRVYFSEHIASERGTMARRLQDWINPLWYFGNGACNCNRETLHLLKHSPITKDKWDVISWQYTHFGFFFAPFVMGLAQKKKY